MNTLIVIFNQIAPIHQIKAHEMLYYMQQNSFRSNYTES